MQTPGSYRLQACSVINADIVVVLGFFSVTCSSNAIISPRLIGPELFDYLSEKDYLEEREARFYMKQLLEAIAYFHENKIIHLDLKVRP